MKKIYTILLLLSFASLFGSATVKDITGKAKVKFSGDLEWRNLSVGQKLENNTLISTGFNSQVILDLGNSTLEILPLTRMTISELSETQDTVKTSLFLQGGKIKADVGKIEGKENDFFIKSPVATASVRGTAFEFTGNSLTVFRGEVSFRPSLDNGLKKGKGVFVRAGGQSIMINADSIPQKPLQAILDNNSISASTKPIIVAMSDMLNKDLLELPAITEIVQSIEGPARITITFKPEY